MLIKVQVFRYILKKYFVYFQSAGIDSRANSSPKRSRLYIHYKNIILNREGYLCKEVYLQKPTINASRIFQFWTRLYISIEPPNQKIIRYFFLEIVRE